MWRHFALFDLDDTLVNRREALVEWAAEFTTQYGLPDDEQTYLCEAVAERASPSTFEGVRVRYRLRPSAEELWRTYATDLGALVSCPAEVLDGLVQLRSAGWRVGVATNGRADIPHAKLRATGIHERVDGVFVSQEADVRKPAAGHFALAGARCGAVLGGDGWMVGDNPVTDVGGGRAAGLRTIWIGDERCWPPDAPPPDHTVLHVRAAIDLLLLHIADQARIPA